MEDASSTLNNRPSPKQRDAGYLGMNTSRRDLLRWSTLASLSHVLGPHALLAAAPETGASTGTTPSAQSIFLRDNFAPVADEVTKTNLRVIGKLPPDLIGMYVRNGPNPMFPPRGNYHWFDGDGMLHGVEIEAGKASYRNRYIRTAGLADEEKAGHAIYGGLLDPPAAADYLRGPNNLFKNAANTALAWHQDKLLALWEAGLPHQIRIPSLETVGIDSLAGQLHQPFTAHPKIDPTTGEMRFFGYGVFGSQVAYGIVDKAGQVIHRALIHCRYASMMHDFATTENYSIFLELPCALQMAPGKPLFHYDPALGAHLGILPARGSAEQIQWIAIEPCFVFHTLNAFEQDGKIHLFACRAKEFPRIIGPMATDPSAQWNDENVGHPRMVQWTIDLAQNNATMKTVDDVPCDFPRVNDSLLGRPTRFGYTMAIDFQTLAKFDFHHGTRTTHDHGPGRFGGEALFVPRPGSQQEDDGWLLSYVFDSSTGKSELVVIDAQDFPSSPIARVLLPVRVPFGFHGAWIPAEAYRS
jgi:carotenoid cleavage dioxygenase